MAEPPAAAFVPAAAAGARPLASKFSRATPLVVARWTLAARTAHAGRAAGSAGSAHAGTTRTTHAGRTSGAAHAGRTTRTAHAGRAAAGAGGTPVVTARASASLTAGAAVLVADGHLAPDNLSGRLAAELRGPVWRKVQFGQ